MKTLQTLFHRETRTPMFALVFASAISVALVLGRIVVMRNFHYAFLIWNLFLAWVPMVFALLVAERFRMGRHRNWRFEALAAAWLLFFPNAPYILTDVVHLITGYSRHFYVDLTIILTCALTGMILGFVSLYLMQGIVRRMYGAIAGWLFVVGVTFLSGFGIYLGRILRFNSWDVIYRPLKLFGGISNWAANPMASPMTFSFPLVFAIFLLLTYLMLYALTHMPRIHDTGLPAPQRDLALV